MMAHIKLIRSFPPPKEIFREYFFLLNKSRLVEEKDAANLNDEIQVQRETFKLSYKIRWDLNFSFLREPNKTNNLLS